MDLYGVRCYLPDPPTKLDDFDHEGTPAGGVMIAVSNDGVHASAKKVRFVSFDSVCQNCSKSAVCTLKVIIIIIIIIIIIVIVILILILIIIIIIIIVIIIFIIRIVLCFKF